MPEPPDPRITPSQHRRGPHLDACMPERHGAAPRGGLSPRSPVGPAAELRCNIRRSYPVSCRHPLLPGDSVSWHREGCPLLLCLCPFSFAVFPNRSSAAPILRRVSTPGGPRLTPTLSRICLRALLLFSARSAPAYWNLLSWLVFLSFCFLATSYQHAPPHSTCLFCLGLLLSILIDPECLKL